MSISIELESPTRIAIVENNSYITTIEMGASTQELITLHPYETGEWNSLCIPGTGTIAFFPPSSSVFINFHLDNLLDIQLRDDNLGFEWFINTTNGDLNHDGTVSISDFIDLASNFGQPGSWDKGDLNHDGMVTISDFIDLASNFGQTTQPYVCGEPSFAAVAVPEPTPAALVALGLLLFKRNRRTR